MIQPHTRTIGWLALACVAILIVLNGKPEFTSASRPARDISDPTLALQMARDVDEVDNVLGDAPSPDREVMRLKQYIDFGFIAAYAALYIALARWLRSRLATIAAICGLAAAAFDIIENLAILRILDVPLLRTTQAMVNAIRYPSLAKWSLAFAATVLFGVAVWNAGRWSMRMIAALDFAAAALGVLGLFDNPVLVWAALVLFAGLILLAVVFLFSKPRPFAT